MAAGSSSTPSARPGGPAAGHQAGQAGPKSAAEVLRLRGLSKSFDGRVVLDGLDLSLRSGENLAILGKSGTGKSVLLRLIVGLLEPDAGEVVLWGRSTRGLSEEAWVPFRRRTGFVFQSGALFDSMTVFDNIAFPLRERRTYSEGDIRRLVEERLDWVELPDVGEQFPSQLSGGMRRRVALARTLVFSPEFILYDEPTTGLDPLTARKISLLMQDLDRRTRSTSILVTHDIDAARIVSSRWAYLSNGKVLADGTPEELGSGSAGEVREFLETHRRARDLPASGSDEATTP